MVRKIIRVLIKKCVEKELNFNIEYSPRKEFGDYSLIFSLKKQKENSKNIFLQVVEEIKKQKLFKRVFSHIEFRAPVFINFFLSKEYLQKSLVEILKKKEKFGILNIGKKIKTNIEYISANPTSQLHIGNGRGAFFGDVLANVLKMAGYDVKREYYINDSKTSNQIQELGKTALGKGTSYLTPYLKNLILKLKPRLKKFKSENEAGYFLARHILMDIKKFLHKKLKIKFDFWISEQNLFEKEKVKEAFDFLKSKNLVYEKDGAIWLSLSRFNQKDEVLIRKNGLPTYFLTDIAYHKFKIERGFKKIINIWGADHQGHIGRMQAVLKILGFKGDFDVLISQIVTLKGQKMSKRKGEIITLEDLINEVGLDVTRFLYLTKSLNSQMDFDLDLAREQSEKNPVYYLQYTYARISSILKKAGRKNLKIKEIIKNLKLLNHQSELDLIKQLIRFPEIIEDCTKDYQLQRIPSYSLTLASSFNQFYRDCRVLNKDRRLTYARLGLVLATRLILGKTLSLMGVSTLERM